jgi:hypothetical protein
LNFLTKKLSLSSQKYRLGIRDPGSGIRKKPIPDPGSRGQKGTGSRIRIRNTADIEHLTPLLYPYSLSVYENCKDFSGSGSVFLAKIKCSLQEPTYKESICRDELENVGLQLESGKRNVESLTERVESLQEEKDALQRFNKLERKRKALESAILKVKS